MHYFDFHYSWEQRKFGEVFDCTVPNNTLSRAELSYDEGTVLNVHYGDVLIKYGSVLDVQKDDIPRIPHRCREDFNGALLQDGDVIIADTAEDETTGKACEIGNLQGSAIVSGLHTMVCRPRNRMALGYLGYYLNSNAYHYQLLPLMQGIKVLSLSRSNIQKTSVSYPSAMKEQQLIASYFSQLDHLITLHQREFAFLCKEKSKKFRYIKNAWEQRKLGDVVDVRSGKDYKHLSEGNIPVYGTGGFMLSVNQALSYDEDAIGIGRKGTIDKPYILKAPFWTVDTLFYAIPREKVDLNFAFDVFQNIDWKKKDESTGVPSLSKTAINEIDVLVPQYDEQQPLGQFFNRIDNLITLHQRKYDKLTNVKKSMLEKMFPQNGSNAPEIRFKGFTEAWEQRKLGEVGTTYTGLSGKTADDFGHGEASFITYMNVFSHPVANSEMVEHVEIDNKQREVQVGDVFFTTSSETPEEVGMSSVLKEKHGVTYLNSFCFGFRPNVKFDLDYLAYMLRSEPTRSQIKILAQGISRFNISKNKMMDINIQVPNLEEQAMVGAYFRNLDHLITLHQRELEKLKNLKKACLEKMFV